MPLHYVEVSHDFIDGIRDTENFVLDGNPNVVESFSPPRPWHQEKYNKFCRHLIAQNQKKK